MTFLVDRYFSENHDKTCQVIKTKEYNIEKMLDIIGMIIIMHNEYRRLPYRCSTELVKDILLKYFLCKDVKYKYIRELPFISVRLFPKVLFQGYDLSGHIVVWLDIDEIEARYKYKNISVLMQKYLSEDEKYEIINYIKEHEV